MGVVYTAFDPELERTIAVKLLNRAQAQTDTSRLQREAQAMARISHPNVLSIHDVGVVDGRVFIAMEYVQGQTLGEWMQATQEWVDVVEVFVGAGRGLAAAHSAELIHRDFKPDNVLVDRSGRPRVLDFGLARAEGNEPTQPTNIVAGDDIVTTGVSERLTVTGAIMGTPAYMAPEQHVGLSVDARADQFSFCVALYEALYQVRPFLGNNVHALGLSKSEGRIQPRPRSSSVPSWVHELVLRGLASNPDERWPTMDALLNELERGLNPKSVRRPWLVAAGIAGAVGAVAAGLTLTGPPEQTQCEDAADQLEVWDQQHRERVEAAFEQAGFSSGTIAATNALIDEYVGRWTKMRADNCRATFIEQTQSGELMDLRIACLDRRAKELGATIELLASGSPAALGEAAKSIEQLPPVDICADAQRLTQQKPPPEDPELRQRVEQTERGLATAQATFSAGLYGEMPALLAALPLVGHPPIDARVQRLRGRTHHARGSFAEAQTSLEQARVLAAQARDDRLVTELDLDLAGLLGGDMAQFEAGMALLERSKADLARLPPDVGLDRRARTTRATVIRTAGKVSDAHAIYVELLKELEESGDDQTYAAYDARRAIAGLDATRGYHEKAEAELETIVSDIEARFGDDHPMLRSPLTNLGGAYAMSGKFEQALPTIQRLVKIADSKLGPEHPDTGVGHEALGVFYFQTGRVDEALAEYQVAIKIYTKVYETAHPNMLRVQSNVGEILLLNGQYDEAHALYIKARDDLKARFGDEHEYLTFLEFGLAQSHIGRKDYEKALGSARAGRAAALKTLGETNIRVAESWRLEATAHLGLGAYDEATTAIDRARSMYERLDTAPAVLAVVERVAGNIAAESGDRSEATRLFEHAHALATKAGVAGSGERLAVEADAKTHDIALSIARGH